MKTNLWEEWKDRDSMGQGILFRNVYLHSRSGVNVIVCRCKIYMECSSGFSKKCAGHFPFASLCLGNKIVTCEYQFPYLYTWVTLGGDWHTWKREGREEGWRRRGERKAGREGRSCRRPHDKVNWLRVTVASTLWRAYHCLGFAGVTSKFRQYEVEAMLVNNLIRSPLGGFHRPFRMDIYFLPLYSRYPFFFIRRRLKKAVKK